MSVRGYRHGSIISFFNYRQGDKNEFLAKKSVFWRRKVFFGDKKCLLAIKSVYWR